MIGDKFKQILALFIIGSFLITTSPQTAQASAPSDYVACWDMDETNNNTRLDASANGYDLTPMNTITHTTGKLSNAVDLENTTRTNAEHLQHADNADLSFASGDISIAAWINIEAKGPYTENIVGKYKPTGNDRGYYFYYNTEVNPDKLSFAVSGDGTTSHLFEYRTNTDPLTTGTWYHVAVTSDVSAESATIYVNGSSVASSKAVDNGTVTSINDTATALTVASRDDDGTYHYFDGQMDIVEMYNRELSSDEIVALYNSGSGVACDDRAAGEDPTYQTGVFNGNAILRGNAVIK